MFKIRILGIDISFSFWFFAVIGCFCALDRAAFFLFLIIPVAIHEAGHIIAMLLFKIQIRSVTFTAFSIDMRKARCPSYLGEICITLAGALANFCVAVMLFLFAFQSMRVMLLISANVAVAVFNLLPVNGLDGGSVVSLLAERFGGVDAGRAAMRAASFLTLTPLFATSIYLLISGSGNITLLISCLYLAGMVIKECR